MLTVDTSRFSLPRKTIRRLLAKQKNWALTPTARVPGSQDLLEPPGNCVWCSGGCFGSCEGDCQGSCTGSCDGSCRGSCSGDCSGTRR